MPRCALPLGVLNGADTRCCLPAQVAFAGRSNAGKSSLLNRLVGQKVARVSKTPVYTSHSLTLSLTVSLALTVMAL